MEDLKLLYTAAALDDLKAVLAWSLDHHPATTDQFASELFARLDLLRAFPALGARLRNRPSIRRLVHAPLHIYYRVDSERGAVEILAIRHAARRPPRF